MAKGKYFGPDKNKGVRPTGKDKYYGPNKYKGVAPEKKAKAKGKGKTANEKLADKLTNAQYAGALGQIGDTRVSNRNQYNRFVEDRGNSLKGELGSNNQTGQIVLNAIQGRKANAIAAAKASAEKQDLARSIRDKAVEAENTNALSNYEALLKARGMDPSQTAAMAENYKTGQGFSAQLDAINRKDTADSEAAAGTAMDTMASQAQMANFTAQAQARANAQKDYSSNYQTHMTEDEKLAAELAKTKLEKGSSRLNTYLTLKKETAQRKAEEAQARLAAGVSMSKQASSDYFKELAANQNQQKIDISAEKVKISSKAAQQKFLATQSSSLNKNKIDIARVEIAAKKAGVTLAPNWWEKYGVKTPTNIRVTSPSDPRRK
jgi:hypothetical protein